MNKYIALCALGVIATDARKHHKKQQHAQKLSNQVLQQEIEELKEEYSMLEHKFEVLSQTVKKQQSLVQSPYGLAGPGGPAYPSPQPFVRGEKQWMDNAQNINDWGDKQVNAANTRIPYQSTVQLEAAPNKYGLAGAGGPAYPSPQPFVRGEKQWMDNAQNINNWGDQQMTVANTRIPYFSTVQLESETEAAPNKYGLGGVGGPAKPSP